MVAKEEQAAASVEVRLVVMKVEQVAASEAAVALVGLAAAVAREAALAASVGSRFPTQLVSPCCRTPTGAFRPWAPLPPDHFPRSTCSLQSPRSRMRTSPPPRHRTTRPPHLQYAGL